MTASPHPYLPRLVWHWDEESPGQNYRCIEGSMVLVDVSGFTRMSERLARHGKVGAEEMTVIIGSIFGDLLSEASVYGSNMLKFGGDALLLFFTDEGHQLRACAAARAMQVKLRDVGHCFTSAGQVNLRMSVGVHSGLFDFFLVGESHRELIVTGPGATRAVEMEALAGAGQVLVSPETASALPKRNLGRAVGPGSLLRGELRAQRLEYPTWSAQSAELAEFIPVGLCSLLLSGAVAPEHRPATVAFIRFQGIDELIESHSAGVAASKLDSLMRSIQNAVDKRGVTWLSSDVASDGGKVILTAGVPTSTGNDEEQMLLAVREVMSSDPGLLISVGVNWGPVFSGEVGPSYRRTYTVMGDTVNLAARLMAQAPPGQVYATPVVLEGSRTTFEADELPPFPVKGKKFLIEAVSVGEPVGAKTRSLGGLPLIGRDEELGRLTDAWEQAESGHGQMVEISAEVGMGKSRIIEEFLATSEPGVVVGSECRLYQAVTPYFPFRALLRTVWGFSDLGPEETVKALTVLVDKTAPEIRPWIPLFGAPLGLEIPDSEETEQLEDQFRPARTLAAVDSLLEATVTSPTVFIIEDTHWMDERSRELLAGLISGLGRFPWLIVLTRRPGDDGFVAPTTPEVTLVELGPLSVEKAKAIIFSATAGSPLRSQQVETLARQADGNPLFLIELIQALRDNASLDQLPQSVEAMIAARIDKLPPRERNLLRRLSVLGAGFQIEHSAAVLGDDGSEAKMETRDVRMLSEFLSVDTTGWAQFQHTLIRDVAYAGLPFSTRQDLHARVGDSICRTNGTSADDFAELLSLHYFYAKRWSRAWRYSGMAGDRAREIYANNEAAAFYERALSSARHLDWVEGPERARVLTSMAKVQYEAGNFGQAIVSLRQAIKLVPEDLITGADLHLELARAHQKLGALSHALRETAIGLRLLAKCERPEAPRARARLRAFRAGIYADQFRPHKALKVGLQAVDESQESGELDALARAYTYIDEAYQTLGQRDMAIHEPMALEILEELGDVSGIALLSINLGVQAYADGRWDEAIAFYSRAQEVSRKSGNEHAEGAAAANLGEVLISRGRLDEAETVLEEAKRVLRGHKDVLFALFAEAQLGRLTMERGNPEQSVKTLSAVVAEAIEVDQPFIAVDASVHLADALVRVGDPEQALEAIEVAIGLAGEDAALYEVPLERVRAEALVSMGRGDEAMTHVERALTSARQQSLAYEEALLLLIKAEAGGPGVNGEVSEEADRLLEDLGASRPYLYRLPSPML